MRFIILSYLCLAFFCGNVFARDDLATDRSRLVNQRNERFYKNDLVRQYISGSGEYDSDEENKQYVLKFTHFYKNRKWISDLDLQHQVDYVKGTKSRDNYDQVKDSELYRMLLSEKFALGETQNYFVFFNESKYDDMSDLFYYDFVVAAGFGRMFFNDQLEIDLAYGINKVKDSHSTITPNDYQRDIWVPAFRTEFEIYKDVRIVQRGFAYYSGDIDGYYFNTRFQYPITEKLYLQLSHLFEKRVYEEYGKDGLPSARINQTDRQILFGFRYDLGKRFQ